MLEFGISEIVNFGSIKHMEFNWGLHGLNIVQAPNGTGKSKVVNSLVWCLYGKTLSGSVEVWEHLRGEDYKGTKVVVNFWKNGTPYTVIRCKSYKGIIEGKMGKNRLLIYEDGDLLDLDDKSESKQELQNIIGYSFELFKNTIVFGQKLKRIVSESGPNKKKILDEAFEVMYISKANKLSQEKLKEKASELLAIDNEVTLLENNLTNAEENLSREKERVKNFDIDKEKRLLALKKKKRKETRELNKLRREKKTILKTSGRIKVLKKDIEKLQKEIKSYGDVDGKLGGLNSTVNHLTKSAEGLVREHNKLKKNLSNLPDKCSNCGVEFTATRKRAEKKRVEKLISDNQKEYKRIIDSIGSNTEAIRKLKSDKSSITILNNSIELYSKELNTLENNYLKLPELEEDITNQLSDVEDIKSQIEELTQSSLKNYIEKFTRTLSEISEELKIKTKDRNIIKRDHDDIKWLISDPLSNSGLKAYIFDQMLGDINNRLEYYGKFSGLSVGFYIDMESSRKDVITLVSHMGNQVSYDELSGGQQQKIDITIIFATHDVVSDSKNCSLMIMDELFESLDSSNIELLTELISDKAKSKNLYLITHRSEFNPTNSNIITLENVDGFTSII